MPVPQVHLVAMAVHGREQRAAGRRPERRREVQKGHPHPAPWGLGPSEPLGVKGPGSTASSGGVGAQCWASWGSPGPAWQVP